MSKLQRIANDLQADSRTGKLAAIDLWKELGYTILYHHDTQAGDSPYIELGRKPFDVWYESPDGTAEFVLDVFDKLRYEAWLTEKIMYKESRATALLSVCWKPMHPNHLYTATEQSEGNVSRARFLALMKVLGKALSDVPDISK